jgi:uncharacterized membrane protein
MALRKPRGRRGSPLYVTPALELLFKSREMVKKNFKVFAVLYFFPLVIGLSNGFWVVDSQRHFTPDTLDAANAIGTPALPAYAYAHFSFIFLVALALAVVLKIMLQAAQLQAAEGHKVSLKVLWQVVKKRGWQFFGLYLAVSILICIWLVPAFLFRDMLIELICFIPAIIMLRRYFVASYVLLENKDMGVWQAMERSARLTGRDSWSIYALIGVMALFALFGIIPYLGWLIAFLLLFYYSAAPAIRYQELKKFDHG